MDIAMSLFWFVIGIGNAAFAAEHFRKKHDFLFGLGVMGVLVSFVNALLNSGMLQNISV